jgi:hypothetical protein
MTGFEKATLRWARIAVLMSCLAAIFVCAQWWEMHSSSGDTHDLAVAAGQQATAANTQSQQAIAQTSNMAASLTKTDDLIRQATAQARATNDLAREAKRSADIAKTTMVSGTRAYLALGQVKLYCPICDAEKSPPMPTQPSPGSNNASVSLFFVNSGHSPAHDIDEAAILYVAPLDQSFAFPEQPDVLEQPKHMMVQASTNFPLEITRTFNAINIADARGQIPCGSSISPPCPSPLYFYGHVSYSDVFNDRHTLLYCVQYHPTTYANPEEWSACPYHNEEYEGDYKPN